LGGITAPVMASGKTLLADCIAILATGVSAPAMKYADTDEEATKTMLAVLAEGDQVVLIDNVERPLEGDTLCAVLTSEAYRQRVLGRTEMMSVPTTTLFLATGNHLVISGDLRTRALLCRIDPKTEHPEQRQFDVELREWITQRAAEARRRGAHDPARVHRHRAAAAGPLQDLGPLRALVGHGARAAHLARLRGSVRLARRPGEGRPGAHRARARDRGLGEALRRRGLHRRARRSTRKMQKKRKEGEI
jgi:hypothetical protein